MAEPCRQLWLWVSDGKRRLFCGGPIEPNFGRENEIGLINYIDGFVQSVPQCFLAFLVASLFCRWPRPSTGIFRHSTPFCCGYWYRKWNSVSMIVLWPYNIYSFVMYLQPNKHRYCKILFPPSLIHITLHTLDKYCYSLWFLLLH
jgi:hypothetical protein